MIHDLILSFAPAEIRTTIPFCIAMEFLVLTSLHWLYRHGLRSVPETQAVDLLYFHSTSDDVRLYCEPV
jgi:hypothetical protein